MTREMMQTRAGSVNLYMPAETFNAIEAKRGLVKRSTYVVMLLNEALGIENQEKQTENK